MWCEEIKQKILNKCEIKQNGCTVWLGGPHNKARYPYGSMTVTLPGENKSKQIRVHRLMYMVHHQQVNLPSSLHVSHLCHNHRCVTPCHLVLEAQEINAERNTCKNNNVCLGTHTPKCIIGEGDSKKYVMFMFNMHALFTKTNTFLHFMRLTELLPLTNTAEGELVVCEVVSWSSCVLGMVEGGLPAGHTGLPLHQRLYYKNLFLLFFAGLMCT